jgi:hypothetical protein
MTSRTDFLVQLLQKLGAPLMEAVNTHSQEEGRDAASMAALLSESVKIAISLSQAMNLKTEDGDADAIRVALASLAGRLIADSHKQSGRLPSENDGRRISKALESVIVFADNFAPAAEHAKRLQTLDNTPPFFDPVQTNIYAIHALLPVISAVSEFSFGQSETRLIQDISDRLGAKAKQMQNAMSDGGNPMTELIVLQALAQVYAGAHRAETKKLREAGDTGTTSTDPVWASFDRQVAMLEVLISSMGGSSNAATGGRGSSQVKPSPEPAGETASSPPSAETSAPAAPPPPAAKPAGSPMSFFKKT